MPLSTQPANVGQGDNRLVVSWLDYFTDNPFAFYGSLNKSQIFWADGTKRGDEKISNFQSSSTSFFDVTTLTNRNYVPILVGSRGMGGPS
jgi:hypothetical protein